MACECSSGVMRTILFVVGFVFLGCAILLSGFSIYVFVSYNNMDQFLQSRFVLVPAAILLAVGVFFVVASLVGFCSAFKTQRSLFGVFGLILLLLIVLLIGATISVSIYRSDIDEMVRNRTDNLVHDYGDDKIPVAKQQVDFVQRTLKCCGVDNYTNWVNTPYGIAHIGHPVPLSCCKQEDKTNCTGSIATKLETGMLYQEGCYEFVKDHFMGNLKFIAIAAVILLVVLVLGTFASCALLCYRREENLPYFNLSADPSA